MYIIKQMAVSAFKKSPGMTMSNVVCSACYPCLHPYLFPDLESQSPLNMLCH